MTAILDLSEKVIGKVHTTLTIVNRAHFTVGGGNF